MYYALQQHETGSRTTLNGRSLDRLHAFEAHGERDEWVASGLGRRHAVTAKEAAQLARDIYGVHLSRLTTETFADEENRTDEVRGLLRVDP